MTSLNSVELSPNKTVSRVQIDNASATSGAVLIAHYLVGAGDKEMITLLSAK